MKHETQTIRTWRSTRIREKCFSNLSSAKGASEISFLSVAFLLSSQINFILSKYIIRNLNIPYSSSTNPWVPSYAATYVSLLLLASACNKSYSSNVLYSAKPNISYSSIDTPLYSWLQYVVSVSHPLDSPLKVLTRKNWITCSIPVFLRLVKVILFYPLFFNAKRFVCTITPICRKLAITNEVEAWLLFDVDNSLIVGIITTAERSNTRWINIYVTINR